ncbi:XRE family transcriptional regulator, partial [Escherichia coli]|nr:XRE family transcriptional regulator [Escherichia coli]
KINTQNTQNLSLLQFDFLLLLAGEHPEYVLCKRESK